MKNRTNYIILSLAILTAILLSISYVAPYDGYITFSDMVLQLSGSSGSAPLGFYAGDILGFVMRVSPMWILEMILGIELYRHFCTASVYVFSRCASRQRWYWKEILSVGGKVFLFHMISMITILVIAMVRLDIEWNAAGVVMCGYHLLIFSLWSMAMTVLVNILSLKLGSSISFMIVMAIQAAGIALLWLGSMFENGTLEQEAVLLWNPMAHLVLGWQRSIFPQVVEHPIYENFYLEITLLLMLLINGMILAVGNVMIKRQELIVADFEIGVM